MQRTPSDSNIKNKLRDFLAKKRGEQSQSEDGSEETNDAVLEARRIKLEKKVAAAAARRQELVDARAAKASAYLLRQKLAGEAHAAKMEKEAATEAENEESRNPEC
jgi:hypothetical protein